jgi:hypothetical protein
MTKMKDGIYEMRSSKIFFINSNYTQRVAQGIHEREDPHWAQGPVNEFPATGPAE